MACCRTTVLALATLVAAGCVGDSTLNPQDFVFGAAQGQVLDPEGSPVLNPGVSATLISLPVNGQSRLLGQASFVANEQGRFSLGFVIQDEEPQEALLAISVAPPPGTGLSIRDTLGIVVQLDRVNPPVDTTYVEIRLAARAATPPQR